MDKNRFLILFVVFVLLLVSAWWLVGDKIRGFIEVRSFSGSYQSVTLANGALYFGKVKQMNDSYLVLEDVFYLRLTAATGQAGGGQASVPTSRYELVKLGSELHGPTDRMMIYRSQVLSLQEMKPDSKVVAAIKDYYQKTTGR